MRPNPREGRQLSTEITLHTHRAPDNRRIHTCRIAKANANLRNHGLQSEYRCAKIKSILHCGGQGDVLYGYFDGFFSQGLIYLMRCLRQAVWAVAYPHSLDSRPSSDCTIVVRRGKKTGTLASISIN